MYLIFPTPIWCVAAGRRTCGGLKMHRKRTSLAIWRTLTGCQKWTAQTCRLLYPKFPAS
ncbi:hypothetical protein GN277_00955 [Lachnospiraceae bacterium WCA-9-b2]|uniref:Uncharacterized protein n=1 Tax=Sporofaciens musculi TaxID=2681861 RepID=A0A7X3MCT4_9FIRM|nr:hypothetical protein [Sporofaciens musculi]MXP74054.1 hypothetical protein [Sporofaciens musculi]